MKHVWVPHPCWPTAESHPASPAVEAFHRSSSPSSCLPAAVPSAGPGPVMSVRQPERHQTSLLSPPPHSAACAEWIRLSLTTPAVEASHRSSSPSSCLPAAIPSAGPGLVLAQEKQSTHYWSTPCSDLREAHESDDEGDDAPKYHPLEVDDDRCCRRRCSAPHRVEHPTRR